jgi:hypothetical protein
MTLILSNDDIDSILTMPDCIDVLEDAYRELAHGRGVSRHPVGFLHEDGARRTPLQPQIDGRASCPKSASVPVRINSDIVTWPTEGWERAPREGAFRARCALRRSGAAVLERDRRAAGDLSPTVWCSACAWAPPTDSG